MYIKDYGIIETLAPLHVGASAGEETGNLNLIFRDQFTQTGIIPGSSIRGRFRADMRLQRQRWIEKQLENEKVTVPSEKADSIQGLEEIWLEAQLKKRQITIPEDIREKDRLLWFQKQAKKERIQFPKDVDERYWYGSEAVAGETDGGTTEARVKFEYASLLWLPVFCPGQPVVWITCPRLLKRYKQINPKITEPLPQPYTASKNLQGRQVGTNRKVLFFNLGFLEIEHEADFSPWIQGTTLESESLVVVDDNDIAILHDMALYRQSRVKLLDDMKKVDTERGAFFNVEALPEGSIFVFPIALKETGWEPFGSPSSELYFGGLESVGFGRCSVALGGER